MTITRPSKQPDRDLATLEQRPMEAAKRFADGATQAQVALLGKPLEVVTVPRPGWVDALVGPGFSRHIAEVLVDLVTSRPFWPACYKVDAGSRAPPRSG